MSWFLVTPDETEEFQNMSRLVEWMETELPEDISREFTDGMTSGKSLPIHIPREDRMISVYRSRINC